MVVWWVVTYCGVSIVVWCVVLHDSEWWRYVMLWVSVLWRSHVWWCINILNGCGGDDGGARNAVPFPILDRFDQIKTVVCAIQYVRTYHTKPLVQNTYGQEI